MKSRADHEIVQPASPPDDDVEVRRTAPARLASWRARLRNSRDRLTRLLQPLWRTRWIGALVAVGTAVVWAVGAGWWTPRSPLTTGQALWSIAISFVVGLVAGLVTRSRWAILVAPVVFAALFELTRLRTSGPTVDAIATSTYGLYAFVVGRGFHALISLFPMAFGAVVGAGIARQLDPRSEPSSERRRWPRHLRRGVAIVAAVGLVGFTALLARPASTAPIRDANGKTIPGSIAELTTVDINGHGLAMMIRGSSVHNPVLLFLAGGPGGSEMGAMRKHLPTLERHFTVVTWDQRGTGKSYDALDPTHTYTLKSTIGDTIAVTNYLRDRFGQDKIYLLGQSWGSTLGVLAVQDRPELYRAFIGTGQMVSQLATDRIFYSDTLAWARKTGNHGLADQLTKIGLPPYDRMLDYETALAHEHEVYPYNHTGNSEGVGGFSENFFVSEYALIDQVHLLGAFMDTFSVLYPQLQNIDFRRTATSFPIPMFFVEGAHEAGGRAQPFAQWYPMIHAPIKDLTVLDTSGHRPLWEQPNEFVDYMVNTVLAQTEKTP